MDPSSFDTLTRGLTHTPSRRAALRALIAAIGGGVVTLHALSGAAKKGKGKHKKNHRASPPPATCETTVCQYEQVCQNGACVSCAGNPCQTDGDCCTGQCTLLNPFPIQFICTCLGA